MAKYLYSLERTPDGDLSSHCWHCKSDAAFTAYKVSGASSLGGLFLSISPAAPLLVCGKCGKSSQKLTTGGKVVVGLSWVPITVLFGVGATYAAVQAVEYPDMRTTAFALVGLTAVGAFVAGFMLWRVLRMPLYPTQGRPVEEGGKLHLGR